MPLIVNAATVIIPLIKRYLTNLSMESQTFATLFEDMTPADTKHPEVACAPFVLPS
jgi:hypothetical protein